MNNETKSQTGAVIIGRNEGTRLRKCIDSVKPHIRNIVYVDSGSTDGSVEHAKSIGIDVIKLDMSHPFTAARARNEGFFHLIQSHSDIDYVQFVDGDCELSDSWLKQAKATFSQYEDLAVVCGRRRERFPDASIYNRFCDIEWNTPIGETNACGGDSLMKVTPLLEAGGFNPTLIAGEEPELCVRLRLAGWKIRRIKSEMTLHDADIHKFSQWWKRAVRTGHAYAEGYTLHGKSTLRHYARPIRSIFIWGCIAPLLMLISLVSTIWMPWSLLMTMVCLLGYAKIITHSYHDGRDRGGDASSALLYGLSTALAKFPQLIGAMKYYINRQLGKASTLIEYKVSGHSGDDQC